MERIYKVLLYQPAVRTHILKISIGFLLGILVYTFMNASGSGASLELLCSGLLGILAAYVIQESNRYLNNWLPWRNRPGQRLLVGIIIQMILASILVSVSLWGYRQLFLNANPQDATSGSVSLKIAILLFFLILIYNIVYFAIYSYHHYARGQVLALTAERKQTELQLNALKSQLSPHFLFNCMNVLSSLISKDGQKAELFIRSLADSYRYCLGNYETNLVPVEKELSFVNAYATLLSTRFGENLEMQQALSDHVLHTKVPTMTLQMLIENAVKHNIMSEEQPVLITIENDKDHIVVSNNKTTKRANTSSLKIGLKNIAERYELLAGKSIEVTDRERFTVKLPLIL